MWRRPSVMTNIVWAKIYLSTKTNVLCAKRVKKTGRHLCFWPVLFYFFILSDALCCYEDDGSQETSQARREVVWWLKLGKLGIPFQPKRGDTTKQPATQVIAVWISWFFLVQFYWIIKKLGEITRESKSSLSSAQRNGMLLISPLFLLYPDVFN